MPTLEFYKKNFLLLVVFSAKLFAGDYCDRPLYPHPIAIQEAAHGCGAACLRSIFAARNLEVPSEEDLLTELKSSREYGTAPDAIAKALWMRGLGVASEFYLTLEHLTYYSLRGESLIVSLMTNGVPHYAVFNNFDGYYVTLMDSWEAKFNGGRERILSWNQFLAEWYYRDTTRAFLGHAFRIWKLPEARPETP